MPESKKLTEAELDQKLREILSPCFQEGEILEKALIIAKKTFRRCKDLEKIRSGTRLSLVHSSDQE